MPYPDNKNSHIFVVDFIDDPIISDPDTVCIAVFQFSVPLGARIIGECVDSIVDIFEFLIRKFFIIPYG